MKIACGVNTALAVSSDNWKEGQSVVAHEDLYSIAEHNGRYVACASHSIHCYYSDDGVNWAEIVHLSGACIHKMDYVNGYFFATGWKNDGIENHVAIWKSINGIVWVDISPVVGNITVPGTVRGVSYKSGTYIASAENGIYYSTNLLTWTLAALVDYYYVVATDNNIFIAGGTDSVKPVIVWSTDGIIWNKVEVDVAGTVKDVLNIFGKWYALTDTKLYESTDDGLTWTVVYTRAAGGFMGLVVDKKPYGLICFTDTTEYVFTADGVTFDIIPIDVVVAMTVEGFIVVDSETNYPANLLGYAQTLVAAAGSIENIANAAITGFTDTTQTAAVAAVTTKIPELIAEYERQMRRLHTVLTILCNAGGVTPPAAFPVLSNVFYTALKQLLDVRSDFESLDLSTIPTPTDQQQLNALEGAGQNIEHANGKIADVTQRLMNLFEVYIRDI